MFADGYRSFGRARIDPGAALAFGDVAMVRAVVPEAPGDARFEGNVIRLVYPGGHGTFYFIPGPDGSTEAGRRRIACCLYDPTPEARLKAARRDVTEADGDARSPLAEDVWRIIDGELPRYFSALFHRSPEIHTQPVYAVKVARHVRGRACLIGDAASVFPPTARAAS